MKPPISTASFVRNRPPLHWRRGFPERLSAVVLAAMLLPAIARAQLPSPAPDGGYPGGNTAEGDEALKSVTIDVPNGAGIENTAIGGAALSSVTSGKYNTALGVFALGDNTASENTGVGAFALYRNTSGTENTGVGFNALELNTTGNGNTAVGYIALQSNSGSHNTASGALALEFNDAGSYNTAAGHSALQNNKTGNGNTAVGENALSRNTTGPYNTATGYRALYSNSTNPNTAAQGEENTADGAQALYSNSTGYFNTASGFNAAYKNTTGSQNTATGVSALSNNTTGSANIAIGSNAGLNLTTGSNNIDIGNGGKAGEANKIRIGKQGTQNGTFIAGIYNVSEPAASGIKPVYINSTGQLGTTPPASSARFKEAIKPMDKKSEGILALKPVTFQYKGDEDKTRQFGLIAEEVAKVNPDLIIRDEEGKAYTVRYEAVNAMLLNEFLKEHKKVEEQGAMIAQQQKQIEALTATVQKVSDHVALSKPAPRLVVTP